MLWYKITACAAVFVMLLLWSWQTDRSIRNHHYTESFHQFRENERIVHAHQLYSPLYTFGPREYVKIIRYRLD